MSSIPFTYPRVFSRSHSLILSLSISYFTLLCYLFISCLTLLSYLSILHSPFSYIPHTSCLHALYLILIPTHPLIHLSLIPHSPCSFLIHLSHLVNFPHPCPHLPPFTHLMSLPTPLPSPINFPPLSPIIDLHRLQDSPTVPIFLIIPLPITTPITYHPSLTPTLPPPPLNPTTHSPHTHTLTHTTYSTSHPPLHHPMQCCLLSPT